MKHLEARLIAAEHILGILLDFVVLAASLLAILSRILGFSDHHLALVLAAAIPFVGFRESVIEYDSRDLSSVRSKLRYVFRDVACVVFPLLAIVASGNVRAAVLAVALFVLHFGLGVGWRLCSALAILSVLIFY